MAKGLGAAWNRLLNVVGLVDVDEEPQRSSANSYEEDRYGYGGQRGYTPTARRNDRPQSSSRQPAPASYSSRQSYGRNAAPARNSSGSSRNGYGAQDSYSEWNTAPRSQNRYANSIYDDDTTLRGGVEGLTENIRIISIVGRFLEHSRIYIFGDGEEARHYISSADWMTRNTLRRVEVATPILAPEIKARIDRMFDVMWRDNVQAREQQPDGSYIRRYPGTQAALSSQNWLYDEAYRSAAEKV